MVHGSDSVESGQRRGRHLLPGALADPRPRQPLATAHRDPRDLGVAFVARPADVVEEDDGAPLAVASENALRKAIAAGAGPGRRRSASTPSSRWTSTSTASRPPAEAARSTLERLSGRTHEVVSGVAVLADDGSVRAAQCVTKVTFRTLDAATLDWYVASGEWDGRPADTPSRAAAARSWSASRATT